MQSFILCLILSQFVRALTNAGQTRCRSGSAHQRIACDRFEVAPVPRIAAKARLAKDEIAACKSAKIEAAVLDALRHELRDPQVTAEYVRTYHEERSNLAAKSARQHKALQKRIDGLKREIDRLVNGIANGIGDPAILGARATERHQERLALIETLEQAEQPVEPIALHCKRSTNCCCFFLDGMALRQRRCASPGQRGRSIL
jgi:hypothetical protein